MNVEIAGCGQLFQYLFKYIHKGLSMMRLRKPWLNLIVIIGPDRAKFHVHTESDSGINNEPIDEIEAIVAAQKIY